MPAGRGFSLVPNLDLKANQYVRFRFKKIKTWKSQHEQRGHIPPRLTYQCGDIRNGGNHTPRHTLRLIVSHGTNAVRAARTRLTCVNRTCQRLPFARLFHRMSPESMSARNTLSAIIIKIRLNLILGRSVTPQTWRLGNQVARKVATPERS